MKSIVYHFFYKLKKDFWEAKDAINMEFMQNITAVFKANFEGLGKN